MARATRGKLGNSNGDDDLPLRSRRMMGNYDASRNDRRTRYCHHSSGSSTKSMRTISDLEKKLATMSWQLVDHNLLYSTMVKVKSDEKKIDDKLKRIAWIGIGEQHDGESTRMFDLEALKEVVEASGDEELFSELNKGNMRSHRHPPGQPGGTHCRGRLIKIDLPSRELKERLLRHMRSGMQYEGKPYEGLRALVCTVRLHGRIARPRQVPEEASRRIERKGRRASVCSSRSSNT
ncbi:hypothetical protein Q1695_003208 [Nippostrongylus brasiliensis]|nr:hypothetical protein Q1695_003208 [Nippostrongylus brasiliensis]